MGQIFPLILCLLDGSVACQRSQTVKRRVLPPRPRYHRMCNWVFMVHICCCQWVSGQDQVMHHAAAHDNQVYSLGPLLKCSQETSEPAMNI